MTPEPEADPADIPAVSTVPVVRTPGGAAAVADLDDRVAAALRHALAPNTWRAYAADWRHWSAWARSYDTPAMPAEPVALARYLADQATTTRITTLTRRLSAIAKAHLLPATTTRPAPLRPRRAARAAPRPRHHPARRAAAVDLRRRTHPRRHAHRPEPDLGRGPGPRRSATGRCCCWPSPRRCAAASSPPSTSPTSRPTRPGWSCTSSVARPTRTPGALVGIPHASRPLLCAVAAIDAWRLRLATLLDVDPADPVALTGPLFRPVDRRGRLGSLGASRHGPDARLSADAIRDVVVRRARTAGLSPAHGQRFFTAHSTRSGFATQAAANGASERAIMDQGRWRSLQVARGYIRRGSVFTDNAAGRLGL